MQLSLYNEVFNNIDYKDAEVLDSSTDLIMMKCAIAAIIVAAFVVNRKYYRSLNPKPRKLNLTKN